MNKLTKIATLSAVSAGLALTGAAQAKMSTDAEMRGYQNCMTQASSESNGLVTKRQYLLNNDSQSNQYYINGHRWEEGDRVAVRVACETSRSGLRVKDMSIASGHYVNDATRVRVEVAER